MHLYNHNNLTNEYTRNVSFLHIFIQCIIRSLCSEYSFLVQLKKKEKNCFKGK